MHFPRPAGIIGGRKQASSRAAGGFARQLRRTEGARPDQPIIEEVPYARPEKNQSGGSLSLCIQIAYKNVYDPATGEHSWVRLVSPQIPDVILSTGNPDILQKFYETHKDTLTPADLKYMKARLHTARKLDLLERQAKEALGRGETQKQPEVTRRKGYTGLSDVRLSGPQTSNNGCWSCGMSLLLQSRGVDLSPEEIRAYRPDFQPGQEQQMSAERRMTMDSDSTNYIYDQADLIQKALPNTCVTNVTLKPLPDMFVVEGGPPRPVHPEADPVYFGLPEPERIARLNAWEKANNQYNENVRKVYNKQVRKQMGDMIRKALTEDRSPLILNTGGNHFITITGISDDGKKLRVEDSFRSKGSTTDFIKIDDLIKKNLGPDGNGMTLMWLKDLPTPEYVPQERPDRDREMADNLAASGKKLFENDQNAVQLKGDGTLTVQDVQGTNITASTAPDPKIGQLHGQHMNDSLQLDQTDMRQELGGTLKNDVALLDRPEATVYLGDQDFYYPKKLCCKGDPALEKGQLMSDSLEKQRQTAQDLDERIKKQPLAQQPGEGTFAAEIYEQKQQLYLQNPDTATYLARLYAVNKVMAEKEAEPGADKRELPITEADRKKIEDLQKHVVPAVSTLLDKSMGKVNMPMMACEDDPARFQNLIEDFRVNRENGVNRDADERRKVIGETLDTLNATGTGRNYFGVQRSRNSDEFDDLMQELRQYKQKLDSGAADGFDHHNLTLKGVKYVSDRMKTRNTTTGVQRFDATMRMLHEIMPAQEFQLLCNRINRARGVASSPLDKDFVSPLRYAPQTAERMAAARAETWKAAPDADAAKGLSEILAARRIAAERDPQRGLKTEVIRLSHEKEDKKLLSDTAKQIRQDPAFKAVLDELPKSPAARKLQLQSLAANGGARLEESMNTQRLLQQEQGPAMGL